MAITATHLTTNYLIGTTSVFTTASISPAANQLVLAWSEIVGSPLPAAPTLTGGGGLTWTLVTTVTFRPIATPNTRLSLHWAATSGSPGSGAVSITCGSNCTWGGWSLAAFTGYYIVQSVTNAADSVGSGVNFALTLPGTVISGNATAQGHGNNQPALTIANTAGSTEFGDMGSTSRRIQSQFFDTGLNSTVTTTGAADWGGIAAEISAVPLAGVGQPTMRRWGGVMHLPTGRPQTTGGWR